MAHILGSLIAALILSAFSTPAAAQTASLKAELLKDWLESKDLMMKITSAMPEDRFGYKPTPPQRSYAEQVMHVATSNVIGMTTLRGKTPAPAMNRAATAKAEVLKALSDSFDFGTAVINEQTEQSLLETIEAVRALGPSSRARAIYFLLGHTWDIYGQMVVYLRLNGGVPPESIRP